MAEAPTRSGSSRAMALFSLAQLSPEALQSTMRTGIPLSSRTAAIWASPRGGATQLPINSQTFRGGSTSSTFMPSPHRSGYPG